MSIGAQDYATTLRRATIPPLGRLFQSLTLLAQDGAGDDEALDLACLSVDLMDGRTIIVPLAWFPRLLEASEEQHNNWRVAGGGYGIHWPDVDEDLSTEGLLRGAPAPRQPSARA